MQAILWCHRLVISRVLDLHGNLRIVEEKPTSQRNLIIFSREIVVKTGENIFEKV